MLVKALIKFVDLTEGKLRRIGDEFEVSEQRFEEILEKGGPWVEKVEEVEELEGEEVDLSKLKRKELEDIAIGMDIPEEEIKAAKNKDELIELMEGRA